uniref:SJCHGC07639 protein n=1 Tax=Schistosoma japonicum TaxID=6182 RepID=Q5D949_SCHJA|nr:SJCHGC07639 protein [Schistosoma japonicum]
MSFLCFLFLWNAATVMVSGQNVTPNPAQMSGCPFRKPTCTAILNPAQNPKTELISVGSCQSLKHIQIQTLPKILNVNHHPEPSPKPSTYAEHWHFTLSSTNVV